MQSLKWMAPKHSTPPTLDKNVIPMLKPHIKLRQSLNNVSLHCPKSDHRDSKSIFRFQTYNLRVNTKFTLRGIIRQIWNIFQPQSPNLDHKRSKIFFSSTKSTPRRLKLTIRGLKLTLRGLIMTPRVPNLIPRYQNSTPSGLKFENNAEICLSQAKTQLPDTYPKLTLKGPKSTSRGSRRLVLP